MTTRERMKKDEKLTRVIIVNRNRLSGKVPYNCKNDRAYKVMFNKCINQLYAMKDFRMYDFIELKIVLAYISKMSY